MDFLCLEVRIAEMNLAVCFNFFLPDLRTRLDEEFQFESGCWLKSNKEILKILLEKNCKKGVGGVLYYIIVLCLQWFSLKGFLK